MKIFKKGSEGIAIIDPNKSFGEEGQYVSYGPDTDFESIVKEERVKGKEIRYYSKHIDTSDGEVLPIKLIITEIPPGHIQPFHTHEKIHEATTVIAGKIVAIDSERLETKNQEEIFSKGTSLEEDETIVEDPNIRHTVANFGEQYAVIYTIQAARIPFSNFESDWIG